MEFGSILGRDFYDRPCLEVAPGLVGAILCRRLPSGQLLAGRIVEVEAYLGAGRDPASHAHKGPAPRNRSMFGPPGRLYVYRSYGVHLCMNLVCEAEGEGAAVLLRAVEPLAGIDVMRGHRGLRDEQGDRLIAAGPGRLTEALGIGIELDGRSVTRGETVVRRAGEGGAGDTAVTTNVRASQRIGISKAVARPYRFTAADSKWLSRRT
ncbi:MAG: DNA-3-methyladenine glycosylase [Myxococcota bacterium]|nr:DNA-3-methyladenine glycosylase [Myxococcota bacterium]